MASGLAQCMISPSLHSDLLDEMFSPFYFGLIKTWNSLMMSTNLRKSKEKFLGPLYPISHLSAVLSHHPVFVSYIQVQAYPDQSNDHQARGLNRVHPPNPI